MAWQLELGLLLLTVFGLLLAGLWVPVALGISGLLGIVIHSGMLPLRALGNLGWNTMNDFVLTAVPLFIFMGQLILKSGLSERFYQALTQWLTGIPGGLLHSNIIACGVFSAVCGSSVATAASIGTVSVRELQKRQYDNRMIFGSLAAGGTLGILIPPSIVAILYAAQTQESVAQLFIAGIGPGLLMMLLFIGYIAVRVHLNPQLAPPYRGEASWRVRLKGAAQMAPVAALLATVLGGIYVGLMTPTEAAGVGAAGALALGLVFGDLNFNSLKDCVKETAKTNCMILFIVLGAQIFSHALVSGGLNRTLTASVMELQLTYGALFMVVVFLYLVLGCFFDGISMMLLTLPLIFPVVTAAGFNPIWFGIALTILIELGQITPPMGLNLFVIKGIAGGASLSEVMWGSAPYCLLMLAALSLIYFFPGIVLWLPSKMETPF